MEEIINGRMYDTETAQRKGTWANTWNDNDYSQVIETLYQKKNGEYFLECIAGPSSIYKIYSGGKTWGQIFLKPIFHIDAVEWAKNKLSANEYEALFGKVSEGAELKTMSVQLTTSNWNKLYQLAEDQETSVPELISKAIEKEYLK
nr:hypothetical protein [Limosilactobacillus reuteri]